MLSKNGLPFFDENMACTEACKKHVFLLFSVLGARLLPRKCVRASGGLIVSSTGAGGPSSMKASR